jgi:N-acetylmuramoyl-L-alanine amidase
MPDADAALRRLCDPTSEVSAHYVIFDDGGIVQCVPVERRAWHAGAALWDGIADVNSHSIGIEIANPGHDHGYPDFPAGQIDAVIALCRYLAARFAIQPARILGHSDVAPSRKQDPGEKFPWGRLYEAGIGHWVAPAPLDLTGPALSSGSAGPQVTALQAALRAYGYGVDRSGIYDALTHAVVRAFQRHFRPARMDGIADASTCATLGNLLAALPSRSGVAAR